jgi:hypothetical protein
MAPPAMESNQQKRGEKQLSAHTLATRVVFFFEGEPIGLMACTLRLRGEDTTGFKGTKICSVNVYGYFLLLPIDTPVRQCEVELHLCPLEATPIHDRLY